MVEGSAGARRANGSEKKETTRWRLFASSLGTCLRRKKALVSWCVECRGVWKGRCAGSKGEREGAWWLEGEVTVRQLGELSHSDTKIVLRTGSVELYGELRLKRILQIGEEGRKIDASSPTCEDRMRESGPKGGQ